VKIPNRMSRNLTQFQSALERDGFAVVPGAVPGAELLALEIALEHLSAEMDLGTRGGVRDAFRLVPAVRTLAVGQGLWPLAAAVLGPDCIAVRGILFDKTPGANWKVSWHQDLTIAVRTRLDVPGFGPWSQKAGIHHVQPPVPVLERMLTLRLHLDDCGADNGPVRVLPGSHRAGRLTGEQIDRWRAEHEVHDCIAVRGEVLAMRPLLLHASSPAASPEHRRVIHLEYAALQLPGGLAWHEAWRPGTTEAGAA
jgi:Phytanoyl-CoA dioxygenase (PhyH)